MLKVPLASEVAMHLDLTLDDTRTLHEMLMDYLPELKREVARTEARELRRELVHRQELCERLLAQLEAAVS